MEQFKIEQLNPNDDEFKVIHIEVNSGDLVKVGDVILTVEGQKTSFDVVAEIEGIVDLLVEEDEYYSVDEYIYRVFESESEFEEIGKLEEVNVNKVLGKVDTSASKEKHIDKLISEICYGKFRIGVIYAGKALRQIEDALEGNQYVEMVGVFDDVDREDLQYLGAANIENILKKAKENFLDGFFIATGNKFLRAQMYNKIKSNGLRLVNVIHPSAIISPNSIVGDNIYIGPNVVISSRAYIESGCFVSAFSNVEHHCVIKENSLLGPGVMLSGSVSVGANSVISSGVSVESNITIGNGVFITTGAGINKNIDDDERIL